MWETNKINLITGIWRSIKSFYFSGKIGLCSISNYIELSVDEANNFTVLHSQTRRNAKTISPEQWCLVSINKRLFIYFGKKQMYEIVTLESELMVLDDTVKGEKIFFAKMPGWTQYMKPDTSITKHPKSTSEEKRG